MKIKGADKSEQPTNKLQWNPLNTFFGGTDKFERVKQ
jgi:hypothetical protein